MSKVIPFADLRVSPSACEFQGFAHGSQTSFILIDSEQGGGPALHRHPYAETFVVIEGNVLFWVGDERIRASAGSVVVVPPNMPHKFENVGPGRLLQIDIHDAPRFETEWLEQRDGTGTNG